MAEFMRTLIPSAKKEFDPFTYRILCDGKLVDFSTTYEGIMKKYKDTRKTALTVILIAFQL